jgi:hypothetical protein
VRMATRMKILIALRRQREEDWEIEPILGCITTLSQKKEKKNLSLTLRTLQPSGVKEQNNPIFLIKHRFSLATNHTFARHFVTIWFYMPKTWNKCYYCARFTEGIRRQVSERAPESHKNKWAKPFVY